MLTELISLDIYRFLMLFIRLGAALMVMPGYSGRLLSARIRLLLALAMAFLLLPVLGQTLPPIPRQPSALALLILGEVTVGLFMGAVMQTLMSAVNVAGTAIGFQVGLTNAFSFDVVAEQQGTLVTNFLSNVALMILFATNMHHLMLQAVVDTYVLFPPGQALPLDDFSDVMSHTMARAFELGLRIAAPLMVFGLIFYSAMGLLSRLAPQIHVFFVALPLQVLVGLWLMMVALPVMMLVFLHWFEEGLVPYLTPR